MGQAYALCICVAVVWRGLLVGILVVGRDPIPNASRGFLEPAANVGLPCPALIKGEELDLIST